MPAHAPFLDDERFEGELFGAFAPMPTEAWHADLADDLGEDWAARLRWDADEGIAILPFYRTEDLDERPTGLPGVRPGWAIRQDLTATDPADAARQARESLEGGADALGLPARLLEQLLSPSIDTEETADTLLFDDLLTGTPLHLDASPSIARRFFDRAKSPTGSLTFDPTAHVLASEGDEGSDAASGYDDLASLLREEDLPAEQFRLVTADTRPFHEAGAGPVRSLALGLASLSEHFAQMSERQLAAREIARHAQIILPVGTRFFLEVARLRAARRLFRQLAGAYGVQEPPRLQIQAVTAHRATTLYDPHLNLLRSATVGAAAAVTAGADVLAIGPFDAAQRTPGDFARRLSLNAHHILREEAHLGDVADPAAGSYYAEVLTDQIARRAWEVFQEIEAGGGLLEHVRSGALRERLNVARDERSDALARRERVRVGTNHYPNLDEERLDDAPAFDHEPTRETASIERIRLATERHARQNDSRRPAAFLLPIGAPKVRSARANFVRNALGCAGFRVVENVGFDSASEGAASAARAVREGEAELVACCAPDEEYAALLPALRDALADLSAPVAVAGRPDVLPEDERAGVDAFLHRGMPLPDVLETLQERLGIARSSERRTSNPPSSHAS